VSFICGGGGRVFNGADYTVSDCRMMNDEFKRIWKEMAVNQIGELSRNLPRGTKFGPLVS
jgi:hypothetical protein